MGIPGEVERVIEVSLRDDLDPQDKRVRADAYKWAASKVLPKVYGDRLDTNVTLDVSDQLAERLQRGRERLAKLNPPTIENEARQMIAEGKR